MNFCVFIRAKVSEIKFNPSNLNDKNLLKISYDRNGVISSEDKEFNKNLNEILNLNLEFLKNNRKAVLQQLYKSFEKLNKNATKKDCEEILLRFSNPNNDKLLPYCGVAIDYINRKIAKFS